MRRVNGRRIEKILLAGCLLLLFTALPGTAAENLLKNSGFETVGDNRPADWRMDYWQEGSLFTVTGEKTRSGRNAAYIYSPAPNDARFVQTVAVKPNTVYRFSGWVATEEVAGPPGANLAVMGGFVSSDGTEGTAGWRRQEVVFRTHSGQRRVDLAVRLGFYGGLAAGKAYFDDLFLEEVTGKNVVYQQITEPSPPQAQPPVEKTPGGDRPDNVFFSIFSILFYPAIILLFAFRRPVAGVFTRLREGKKKPLYTFAFLAGIVTGAVLLRWPGFAAEGFPAGPEWLTDFFGERARTAAAFFVLLGDAATAWLIYVLLRKTSFFSAVFLSVTHLFLPAVVYNSSLYPLASCRFFLPVLIFFFLTRRRPAAAVIITILSVLLNIQTIIYIPLILVCLFTGAGLKKKPAGAACGAVAFILALFLISGGELWRRLANIWTRQVGYLFPGFAETPNFLTLFNLTETGNAAGVNYNLTGAVIFLVCLFWLCRSYRRAGTAFSLAAGFLLTSLAFFLFWPGVHHTALLPVLVFALLCYGFSHDRKIFFPAVLFSIAGFLHPHMANLFNRGIWERVEFLRGVYILSLVYTALFGVFLFLTALHFPGWEKVQKTVSVWGGNLRANLERYRTMKPFSLTGRDRGFLTVCFFLYLGMVLFRLGSTAVPQTGTAMVGPESTVEVEMEQAVDIAAVGYFEGRDRGRLKVLVERGENWEHLYTLECNDFYKMHRKQVNISGAGRLRLEPDPAAGRVKEVAFFDWDGNLLPVKKVVYPATGREAAPGETPLFDEQDLMENPPSYMNSTYFDEIYHGRTAYEFIKKLPVYETTHPPLGKVLLSVGIRLFGMNPFGMRFINALAGAVLVVLLFFLAREILYTRFAAYTALLLAFFDFMPFVQSRYATIDTFSVIFIVLMYLFLFKYVNRHFSGGRLSTPQGRKPALYAGLTILSFALGAGVKWTAVYGFAGVVMVFCLLKFCQFQQYRNERQKLLSPESGRGISRGKKKRLQKQLTGMRSGFWGKTVGKPLLVILVLFILIAPSAYYLPYLPYLQCGGINGLFSPGAVATVTANQKGMYDYHSRLTDTHPFSSSWWGWPFDFRPLWIYSNNHTAPENKETIVSMGNPAVWWAAVAGVLVFLYLLWTRAKFSVLSLVFVGMLSLYLPWVLVTRAAFIYHFYPVLPFAIIFLTFLLESFWQTGRGGRYIVLLYFTLCLILLIVFYPALSGLEISRVYVDRFLRWFPHDWIF